MSQDRIKKAQVLVDELNLSSLLISNPLNIYYLTGFKGVSVTERETLVLIRRKEAIFFVPQIYTQEGQKFAKESGLEVVPTEERHVLFQEAAKNLKASESVGFEETNLRFNEYKILSDNSKAKLFPTNGVIEDVRIIKDKKEIELAQKAVDITDQTYEYLTTAIKPGMTEKQVAKMIKNKMEDLGADGFSFDPLVASGKGSALPHYSTSDKKIEEGVLLIDMGAMYKGYMGDLTRTMYVGKPTKEFIKTYELVKKAEEKTIAEVKSGMTCENAWKIAVDVFGEESKYFIHGLGHGLGLDIHEDPYLRKGIKSQIPNNCLITIEPGLYYPKWGGIRIEDYCLFTESGSKVMSKASKEIICL